MWLQKRVGSNTEISHYRPSEHTLYDAGRAVCANRAYPKRLIIGNSRARRRSLLIIPVAMAGDGGRDRGRGRRHAAAATKHKSGGNGRFLTLTEDRATSVRTLPASDDCAERAASTAVVRASVTRRDGVRKKKKKNRNKKLKKKKIRLYYRCNNKQDKRHAPGPGSHDYRRHWHGWRLLHDVADGRIHRGDRQ